MSKQNVTRKKAMIEALIDSLGVVTTACSTVGISRKTHYEWLKSDSWYKEEVKDIENISIDVVESELYKQIKEGNTTATIFYLKTKGKKRGYSEKVDNSNDDFSKDISILEGLMADE